MKAINRTLVLVVIAGSLLVPVIAESDESHHDESHHGHKHHGSLFRGNTHDSHSEDAFTAGLDYEFRVHKWFDLAALIDHAAGDIDSTVAGAGVFLHPWGDVRLGPYYKHQRWEDGRNVSRRVPTTEAEPLRKAVEGYHEFETLADEYAQITIEMTRRTKNDDSKKSPDHNDRTAGRDRSRPTVHTLADNNFLSRQLWRTRFYTGLRIPIRHHATSTSTGGSEHYRQ